MGMPDDINATGSLPDQALVEASDWHLRLQDTPDDLDMRVAFDEWHDASSDNRGAWALLEKTLGLTKLTEPVYQADWHFPSAEQKALPSAARRQRHRPGITKRPARRIALGAVAASLLALVAGPEIIYRLRADHLTGVSQSQTIRLSDGSTVILGAQSAITERLSSGKREIALLGGEAWFDVAHDRTRPFTVQASNMTVTVTGTTFDVSMTDRTLGVAVARGSVWVERAGTSPVQIALKPGQHFTIDRDGGTQAVTNVSAAEIGTWRSGRLAVRNASLADVIEILDRHYRGHIFLRGNRLEGVRVTGVYDLADPVGSVRTLLSSSGASMLQITPWLIVLSDRRDGPEK
ncbi:MAG: FecR domain-containing protein [Novosphingobium sp.]